MSLTGNDPAEQDPVARLLATPLHRRTLLRAGLLGGAGLLAAALVGCGDDDEVELSGTVSIISYPDYFYPELLSGFKEETGVDLNPVGLAGVEELYNKLKTSGSSDFDIADISDDFFPLFVADGLVEPLDPRTLPSGYGGDLYPFWFEYAPYQVDGTLAGLPLITDVHGPCYRPDKVESAPTSWGVLFDPTYKGRVGWRGNPRILSYMAMSMGIETRGSERGHPGTRHLEPDELKEVTAAVIAAKKAVNPIIVPSLTDALGLFIRDEVDVGYGATTFPVLSPERGGPAVEFIKPSPPERVEAGSSFFVLMKDAKNRDGAIAFLDFLTWPENRVEMSLMTGYCSPSPEANRLLTERGYGDRLTAMQCAQMDQVIPNAIPFSPASDVDAWAKAWAEVQAA